MATMLDLSNLQIKEIVNPEPSLTVLQKVEEPKNPHMSSKWLSEQLQSLKTIRILCFGDCKIGKSDFLRKYTADNFLQPDTNEDAGEVHTKIVKQFNPKRRVGVELLELPSSANLLYLDCYPHNCDAIIFFFQTSTSKLRWQLAQYLRHHYSTRIDSAFHIPILLIGLFKDKYTPKDFTYYRLKQLHEMHGVIAPTNILFFGKNCEACDFERQAESVHRFVRKVISRSLDQEATCEEYMLQRNAETYRFLFTARELLEMGFRFGVGWLWRKLGGTEEKY